MRKIDNFEIGVNARQRTQDEFSPFQNGVSVLWMQKKVKYYIIDATMTSTK